MSDLTLTIESLRKHSECDLDERIAALESHLGRKVRSRERIPLQVWAAVPWRGQPEHSAQDLIWALRCCPRSRAVSVEVACRTAERVLPLVREQDRAVCREAIVAARGGDRERARRAARAAAYAAVDAAARAAAYAAYAERAAQRRDLAELLGWTTTDGGANV
jgi:hypothetical protein